jgi:hypothetical protein
VLSKALEQVSALQIAAKQFVFDSMFNYIREKLLTVPTLEEWRFELPDAQTFTQFSLSAQVRLLKQPLVNLIFWIRVRIAI